MFLRHKHERPGRSAEALTVRPPLAGRSRCSPGLGGQFAPDLDLRGFGVGHRRRPWVALFLDGEILREAGLPKKIIPIDVLDDAIGAAVDQLRV